MVILYTSVLPSGSEQLEPGAHLAFGKLG